MLSLGVLFRLWHLDVPLVDAHSWRQITNADIARHFAESTWNLFRPEVSWGGWNGVVGLEFPLAQWVTGLVWRATGESHVVARLVAIVWSVAGIAAIYGLGARLFGRPAGLGAATLMAVAPSTVYFGRSFLSDTPMVSAMIGAVWAWDVYFERPSAARGTTAALLTALAALVKLPAILVLAPIAATGWRHRGWGVARDGGAWAYGGAAVALVAAWYWYADRIFLETGLTQAVFRPSGTYPEAIAPGVEYVSVSHWTTRARLVDPATWIEFVDRFWMIHLTALGALSGLVGLVTLRGRARAVVDLWFVAAAALVLVALEGQVFHEFHQLPVLPPLFLYAGAAAAPLFDTAWQRRAIGARSGPVVVAAIVFVVAVQGFRASGVERNLYRPDNLQENFIVAGARIREATASDALVVTLEYEAGGANSPMLLYFAHRQGWSFDVHSFSASTLAGLHARHGARYFATLHWPALADTKPDDAAAIERSFRRVPLDGVPSSVRLFDLAAAP